MSRTFLSFSLFYNPFYHVQKHLLCFNWIIFPINPRNFLILHAHLGIPGNISIKFYPVWSQNKRFRFFEIFRIRAVSMAPAAILPMPYPDCKSANSGYHYGMVQLKLVLSVQRYRLDKKVEEK